MSATLSNILTEAGTNEVEVLVFALNGGRYGVNVAKVREIILPVQITCLPQNHEAVRGVFKLRDHVLPLVDLRKYFNMQKAETESDARVIVMEFNSERLGFLVDHVERIHRVSWKAMAEVPYEAPDGDLAVTSVLHVNNEMVLMLDFERIALKIAGIHDFCAAAPAPENLDRTQFKVLLADDSPTMRRMLLASLKNASYNNIEVANDGEDAWNKLNAALETASLPDIIVTDIEMPKMDGLHLTKRIKEHPQLKQVPIIVFSSLVSDDNIKKCQSVGADRQLTKPQLPSLVSTIDELLGHLQPA